MADTNLGTTSTPEAGIPPVGTDTGTSGAVTSEEKPSIGEPLNLDDRIKYQGTEAKVDIGTGTTPANESETKPGDDIEFGFKGGEVTAEAKPAAAPDLTVPNTEPNPVEAVAGRGVDDSVKSEPVFPVAEPSAETNPAGPDSGNVEAARLASIKDTIAQTPDTPTAPATTPAAPETTAVSASTDPEDHWGVGQAPQGEPAAPSPFVEPVTTGEEESAGTENPTAATPEETKKKPGFFARLFGRKE